VQEDHEVVRTGPYRVIRHPAYAGALVAIVGLALTLHNAAAIVVYLACAGFAIGYRIRVEERVLRTELGHRYTDYAETTARLVPHVW
jgi:protein-S-isoprenylcysteine O-methyltransferase Ste14